MLKIYNTLKRKKEEFKPRKKGEVSYYHCGPTVYSYQHIGNYRAAFVSDIVVRTLQYLGYKVTFVTNMTDVGHLVSDDDEGEDKMEKAAKREKKTSLEIADFYANDFLETVRKLNITKPDFRPRPTKHIKEQTAMIKTLLEKGYAYQTKSAIYFDVSRFKDYGKLSGQSLDEKKEGVREDVVTDPEKRNPQDFALWFFTVGRHKNHELQWDSPWGKGFPGWHIECSAMSMKYLGDTIDIHSGGVEHIPVHHENEIAQSEATTGKSFVRYWMHLDHLIVDNTKMSKSLGNVYLVQGKKKNTGFESIEEKGYDALDLRYFYLQAHYRTRQNFTFQALDNARAARKGLMENVHELASSSAGKKGRVIKDLQEKFRSALEDDFNTPQALAAVYEVLKSDQRPENKLATILDFDKVLGLNLSEAGQQDSGLTDEEKTDIEQLLEFRERARENEEWERADQIRDELKEKFGVEIEDGPEGTNWKKVI